MSPIREPPWIWLYFGADLLLGARERVDVIASSYRSYRGLPAGSTSDRLLHGFLLVSALPMLFLLTGLGCVGLPGVRRWWVEKHHGAVAAVLVDPASPIQRFLDRQAPGVQLWLSPEGGRYAQIYPARLRTARIMGFAPLLSLWDRDRPAAEAILRHEIAHHRQGEHLVLGLGSPLRWLVRVCGDALLVLTAFPLGVLALSRNPRASTLSAQVLLDLTLPLRVLMLPVLAIWAAELAADRWAATGASARTMLVGLEGRTPPDQHLGPAVFALLDHPPLWLRRAAAARAVPETLRLNLFPLACPLKLLLVVVVAAPAWRLIGTPWTDVPGKVAAGVDAFLVDSRPLLVSCAVLLLVWPVLGTRWARLWSPAATDTRSLPLRPYLVAACAPAAMVLATAFPLSTTSW